MAQWVQDLVLPLLRFWLLLWLGFDPWPGNFPRSPTPPPKKGGERYNIAGFEDGGRGHKPRDAGDLQELEKAQKDPGGTPIC